MCATSPVERDLLTVKYQLLIKANESLQVLDQKIIDQMVSDDWADENQDQEYITIEEYQSKVYMIRVKIEKIYDKARPASPNSTAGSVTSEELRRRAVKLPPIELKKFSGQLTDWLSFWSQFQKIDEDISLYDSDKMQYLLQCMEPDTEAFTLVDGYHPTGENYKQAVEALKERFGDEDLLLQVYVRELLQLVISNVSSKEKLPLQTLYLKLESQLRALKTLKLESADPATWLFPLVESSLSEEILLAWQRSPKSQEDESKLDPPKTRLDLLMDFVKNEVQIKQKISLAQAAFQEKVVITGKGERKKNKDERIPTLAGCLNTDMITCAFCEKKHDTKDCFSPEVLSMSLEEKRNKIKDKKCCLLCLKPGHQVKKCRAFVKCRVCFQRHYAIMCPGKESTENNPKEMHESNETSELTSAMTNHICSKKVILQTLMVNLGGNGNEKLVRAFIDNGSQRSYVLKSTAKELGLVPIAEESVTHSLFGGTQTISTCHKKYSVELKKTGGKYACLAELRDQERICTGIPRVSPHTPGLLSKLKQKGIWISDLGDNAPPIELLIGIDLWAKLLSGNVVDLENGIIAVETKLGWTLCGEMLQPERDRSPFTMETLTMSVQDMSVTDLWNLETIGIKDPIEIKTSEERNAEAKANLIKSIIRQEDGRYEVGLPWAEGHPPLPSNKNVAEKRLENATKKLKEANLFAVYDEIFKAWENEGFIEKVPEEKINKLSHYLPHRPVIKMESLTTPVRPVFDASSRAGKAPSLNDCLQKGVNYIQLIPEVFLRFREKEVGAISDIRKAFQMIEVRGPDRDMLRFLWWENFDEQRLITYRHKRVVFGATCSPFILGAVLEYHLTHEVNPDDEEEAKKLIKSLYVDNCVGSFGSYDEYISFKDKATDMLNEAKMELRMWMTNKDDNMDDGIIQSVLGYKWNRSEDTIYADISFVSVPTTITKRCILSAVNKIFDPLGFLSPATIPMKILLQQAWISKIKWDEELPPDSANKFIEWHQDLRSLSLVKIPRVMTGGGSNRSRWSLHMFSDASQSAYAAAIFLRVEHEGFVSVNLVAAKSRVAPLAKSQKASINNTHKTITIPRLELLGCLIGVRLTQMVKRSLNLNDIEEHYWTDSSTALAWILRDNPWATFVGNRVAEINKFTSMKDWHHVPGNLNPADLPSRGCSPSQLLESKWWEGPSWLSNDREFWPVTEEITNEDEVLKELKRSSEKNITCLNMIEPEKGHSYTGTVNKFAWVLRFIHNSRNKNESRRAGPLTFEEYGAAELKVIKIIQDDSFPEGKAEGVQVTRDENGLLRIKTKIIMREDLVDFVRPYLLPSKNPLVRSLIEELHIKHCHAGVGFLMCKLRENYWILQARRTIKNVLAKCIRCRRYAAKQAIVEEGPLPVERIKDADVFEIIGVDLAGPLFLRNGNKVWVVAFTCAVYRAIHLELVTSLSTRAFISAMAKFVDKYRRPDVVFSDNGTNFVGATRLFKELNWNEIMKAKDLKPINWKFNPPAAPWWGGFWERLIRTMKDLMKRTIGRATLTKDELAAVLVEIAKTMNGRPLTYVSDDPEDLVPLTPSMFMKPNCRVLFPEKDLAINEKMRIRYKYVQQLQKELKQRFRKEYLSQLINKNHFKITRPLEVGELVLVSSDNRKRIDWPLGRIVELMPGKDGVRRVARVKTQTGVFTRPVQRLYPLELHLDEEKTSKTTQKVVRTRSGRVVKHQIN